MSIRRLSVFLFALVGAPVPAKVLGYIDVGQRKFMNAVMSFEHLKACLTRRLAPSGFVGAGNLAWCKMNDTVVVIEVQRDRKYSADDEIRFTVNIGISVDALRDVAAAAGGPSSSEAPPSEKCHWRQRIGRLLPAQSDVWWSVRDEQSAQAVCDEIAGELNDIVLPKIKAMASSEALVRSWKEDRGQGLTEYERRKHLARLLVALGRNEEAKSAVEALEKSSIGKSWAASAAYDAKVLRKLIL